jgi:hypothetical protein
MSNTQTRKLTVVRKPNEPLRLEESEAVHVGVDAHKATFSVALVSDRRGLIATWVQPARPELLIDRLRPVREGIARVVYEAGPTGFAGPVAGRLPQRGAGVQPRPVPALLGDRTGAAPCVRVPGRGRGRCRCGLMVTMAEKSNVSREVEAQLRSAYGGLVYQTTILRSVKIEEAHSRSQAVIDYAPQSTGAKAYLSLVEEILTNGQHGQADRTREPSRGARAAHAAA